jgi:DNA mismatch repair protein MutS
MSNKKTVKTTKPDSEPKTHEEYFQLTKEYQSKYGEQTLVLMQVGAFFEIYGMKHENGEITGSKIVEITEYCQLNISEKKISYENTQLVMAGFRDYTLDKYLLKLTEFGYTVAVYIQEKDGKDVKRVLDHVYSSGTYISCDTDSSPRLTNNIMCIWMELFKPTTRGATTSKTRDTLVYGVSIVNIFTGKSSIFQYETAFYMNTTTFDELERYVSIFAPSEVILLSPFEDSVIQSIIQFTGIHSSIIHKVNNSDNKNQKVVNCSSQKYIKQILTSFFNEETYDICSEFHNRQMATQSYCYLLNFIQEHNTELVKKIALPEFDNTSDRLLLANHTLLQLNIIGDNSNDSKKFGQLSSVSALLNKCCSAMGRRKFQYQLTNPTFDEEWLNKEYEITTKILDNYNLVDIFRKQLLQMRDIEKLSRQLVLKKIYPSSIYHLYKSVQLIQNMNNYLGDSSEICDYLCDDFLESDSITNSKKSFEYIDTVCNSIISFLDSQLFIDECKLITSMSTFDENIIKTGVSLLLDQTIEKYNTSQKQFQEIQQYFNDIMKQNEKGGNNDTEYIKVHETEKSGVCLQITKKRSQTLEIGLKNIISKTANQNGILVLSDDLTLSLKDVKFIKASSTNVDIDFPLLNEICKNLLSLKDVINNIIMKTYLEVLKNLDNHYFKELEELAYYVSKIDVMQSKAYIAKQYKYCRPVICQSDKAFVDVRELRHCLIEHIQQNEIYVTNDVVLGKSDTDGILLYGTNAVGKTSFIRALGIAIIMAQSGMYVPCSQFCYKPYTAIFSRILGNDNIFKGLSTFAVEMSELRIILKMADKSSLILGDELCSGTEMESALSIFVSGLMNLHEKESSFIFATHFHEIVDYEEIKALSRLKLNHMAVVYDNEKDSLVYDRKLKEGSGPRIYGLEVCKSLYLDQDFLENAYFIRNKYYPETRGELSHNTTVYNSEKIRGKCEICENQLGEEIHHLKHQKDADDNGFIGTFHKNHPANLISVCENCHNSFHDSVNKTNNSIPNIRKKTTKGYVLV